jgi:hypothetical protein
MSKFIVSGAIAGEYLPASAQVFDTVAVLHDPETIQAMVQSQPGPVKFSSYSEGVIVSPTVDVKSRWRVDFLVEADSEEDALQLARENSVPLFLAALGASTGERYAIDLLQAFELDGSPATLSDAYRLPRRSSGVFHSKLASALIIIAKPLTDDVALSIRNSLRVLAYDEVGRKAAGHFSNANELMNLTVITPTVIPPVLTSCFLCIETLVKAVAPTVSKGEAKQKEQQQKNIVADLQAYLSDKATRRLGRQVQKIREACRWLQELEQNTTKIQLKLAADALGIDSGIALDAESFVDFRHKFLAHATPYKTEIAHWFGEDRRAQKLAGAFLKAYLDYRTSGLSQARS